MSRYTFTRSFSALALFLLIAGLSSAAAAATDARISESYGKLPLQFEANRGQTQKDVQFLSRGAGYSLYLTGNEAVLVLAKLGPDAKRDAPAVSERRDAKVQAKPVALRMSLVDAARKPQVSGIDELPGKANYFIGNDQSKWRTNIPTYAKVRYGEVYPGIDLVYYGNQRQLEYDFIVTPGADPKKIVLGFKGAEKLEIDAQGDLVLHAGGGAIHQKKPVIYQESGGIRTEIEGGYVLKGANRVGFKLAAYDSSRPLVIDPVLSYSSYLGGRNGEAGIGIAVDAAGNAYIVGATTHGGFPTTSGAFQPAERGVGNAFVAKVDPTGSALVYSTYLGGTNGGPFSPADVGLAIAVDSAGNAYLTGRAGSPDFPTTAGAFQTARGGGSDAFVTKLNPAGSALVYSTRVGGIGDDQASGIAVDANGNAYVVGATSSTNFPTTAGAFQTAFAGGASDAFVTKLNSSGSALVYSTYLGAGGDDGQFDVGIAVDAGGNAYVTGGTSSANFPTTAGAFQTTFAGGGLDAFVTKLDPTGAALVYSTYLGGSGADSQFNGAIAVDKSGNAYVTGSTSSSNFPTTVGAFQPVYGGGPSDAFVTKLDAAGAALVYSTYLGGSGDDFRFGGGIAVDTSGNAYVTGSTNSSDFPTTPGAFQPTYGGRVSNAFVTKLNPAGTGLAYSSFLGGEEDRGFDIAVDAAGNAYVTGETFSENFPTTAGAFDTTYGSPRPAPAESDAFVTKLALGAVLLAIDKNGIDDKKAPTFFSPFQVNNDVAAIGVRAQLRFFRDRVGETITLPTGEVGDEGWFALKTIPASWTQAGGAAGYVGNPAANPEDPPPHGTGPGLGAPDANGDPDSLLRRVPGVTPLRATALNNLIGREVCAVVYDHQMSINQDQRTGDLRGANLGTVAFQVVALTPSTDASSSSLPNVEARIRDARTVCRGPFALLTDAEAPTQ